MGVCRLCPFVEKEANGSYLFANELNGLEGLNGPNGLARIWVVSVLLQYALEMVFVAQLYKSLNSYR